MDEKDVNSSNEELLDSLNLLENGVIKRAGILLFHHKPEKWIPGAYVKIGYFETDADLRYQDEIHGSLIEQADKVVDLIFTKYLKAEISYEGVTRVEIYPYPKAAIREAVYNAIAHKFYGALIPIQISVYKDRLYIANDCIFPEDWTVENLLGKHRSRAYNPLIANTFFWAGFIEAWGRGIEKIRESCKNAGNEMPEYQVMRDEITVVFKGLNNKNVGENVGENLAKKLLGYSAKKLKKALEIIEIIKLNSKMTQQEVAHEIGSTERTVTRYMTDMKNAGLIIREGGSNGGSWKIL